MSSNNSTVINNHLSDQTITLGDVPKDQVNDYSVGYNTITLGQGAGDSVHSFAGFDTISLGGGKGDSVFLDAVELGFVGIASSVVLGNGAADTVVDSGRGLNNIALGDGAGDFVYADTYFGDGPAVTEFAVTGSITVGNGGHDVVQAFEGLGGYTIQTGSGSGDVVQLDTGAVGTLWGVLAGASTVSFGGPNATLDLSQAAGPSPALPDVSGLDIISGLIKGDHIVLSGGTLNTDTAVASTSLGGVANEAVLTPGTYDPIGQTFTAGAGPDALLTYDTQGFNSGSGYLSVVLVGAAHEIHGTTIHAGVITLG